MKDWQFEHLKAEITAASAEQILELEDVIQHLIKQKFTEIALAPRSEETLRARTCPHCQGKNIVLHGKDQNGRQRLKCQDCRKTYNIMTGTPMARARMPEKWGTFVDCMNQQMSVRKIVASGIGIDQVTAWRWRKRFLQTTANGQAAILSGVVQADETISPRAFKESHGRIQAKPRTNRVGRPRRHQTPPAIKPPVP
jgi:transposase-like protein